MAAAMEFRAVGTFQHRESPNSLSPLDANYIQSRKYTSPSEPDSKTIEIKLPPQSSSRPSNQAIQPLSIEAVLANGPSSLARADNARQARKPPNRSSTYPVNTLISRHSQVFSRAIPGPEAAIIKRLPPEVFDCIMAQLQMVHSDRLSPSCATCYMRDLTSLALTSKAWSRAAHRRLYGQIRITGHDSSQQLKKTKLKIGSRLVLLRRTLRRNLHLAGLVTELCVSNYGLSALDPKGEIDQQSQAYLSLVASVIMECPKLEVFSGLKLTYSHEFSRLIHALSTRRCLKEHLWLIGENDEVTHRSQVQLPPGLLDHNQIYQFLQYHTNWTRLQTLMFHSLGGSGILEHGVFEEILGMLPSLQHLCVSSFDLDDFNDKTLLCLPSLKSLRLETLPGVTDQGLSRWAASPRAQKIEKLKLIQLRISSLLAISKILASLPCLTRFAISQSEMVPELPTELMIFQPILASNSLRHLHWDVEPAGAESESLRHSRVSGRHLDIMAGPKSANTNLALSIVHGGFPNLLSLRAPRDTDPPGALQSVCCPSKDGKILLATDKYAMPSRFNADSSRGTNGLPTDNSLKAARIRSQHVIDSNAKTPTEYIKVVVTDHSEYEESRHDSWSSQTRSISTTSGHTSLGDEKALLDDLKGLGNRGPIKIHEFSLPKFVGRVSTSSKGPNLHPPKFNLLPDVHSFEGNGGIIGWEDFLGKRRTGSAAGVPSAFSKDGCTGHWNISHKGGPNWWKHTERDRRVNIVEPKMFF